MLVALPSWTPIHNFFIEAGLVLGVIGGAITAYRKGLTPMYRAIKHGLHKLEILDDIAKEFQPNGGSSMIDRLGRLESNQNLLLRSAAESQARMEQHMEEDRVQFAKIREHLDIKE